MNTWSNLNLLRSIGRFGERNFFSHKSYRIRMTALMLLADLVGLTMAIFLTISLNVLFEFTNINLIAPKYVFFGLLYLNVL